MTSPHIDFNITDDVIAASEGLHRVAQTAVLQSVETAQLVVQSGAELSILLSGDTMIRDLNREWRGKDQATNVLSFPGDPQGVLIGDIAISLETTKREADLENRAFTDHFSHLVVHGFLHLFGYDHEEEEEALKMESLETRILSELGIADPYSDGSTT